MTRVSVCMATFNGRAFLSDQINSIIDQLGDEDEIVIVDDVSSDGTVEFIEGLKDSRIRLFQNEKNIGACGSFERAIGLSQGKYILMSDQDDVWCAGKVDRMCSSLDEGNLVAASNFIHIDIASTEIRFETMSPLKSSGSKSSFFNIVFLLLGRMQYFGSAMAFREEIKSILIPFPDNVEAHDHFISLIGNISNSMHHLDECLIKRRIHGNNLSLSKRSVWSKLKTRTFLLLQIVTILYRMRKFSIPRARVI